MKMYRGNENLSIINLKIRMKSYFVAIFYIFILFTVFVHSGIASKSALGERCLAVGGIKL